MADHGRQKPAILQPLLDTMAAPLAVWAADGSLLACSAEFARLLDQSQDGLAQRGRLEIVHPDDRAHEQGRIEARRGGHRAPDRYRLRFMTRTGGVVRADVRTTVVTLEDGMEADLVECLGVEGGASLRDALEDQAAQYANLFDQIAEAIYSLEGNGQIATANAAAERLFGRSLEEMKRTPSREILGRQERQHADMLRDLFVSGERVPRRIEFPIRRPDGEVRWVSGSLLMMRDPDGGLARSWVVARDITALKEREERLAQTAEEAMRQAKVDPLTGLGNRRAFDEAWEACGVAARSGRHATIFVMDMDDLKAVNDAGGHAAGDEAIRAVGAALQQRTRGDDRVYRIGGDEFVVVAQGNDAEPLASRLAAPIPFREPVRELTVSLGWAILGLEVDDPGEAFRLADNRMYEVKRERRAARGR